jgi:hypothetical protein
MTEPINPYEAPQSHELPTATLADLAAADKSLVYPPREVKRWLNAALALYFVSFVVPFAPWLEDPHGWEFGIGLQLFLAGLFWFWHPYVIAWWANLFFWLSWHRLHRASGKHGLIPAIIGMLLSMTSVCIARQGIPVPGRDINMFPGPLRNSVPYYCWLGSMLLMLIAAMKLRRVVRVPALEDQFDQA